jgi:hypothetical protein
MLRLPPLVSSPRRNGHSNSAHRVLKRDEVPQLGAVRDAKRRLDELNATRHWELTEADFDKIKADLTGHQRIPAARGIA